MEEFLLGVVIGVIGCKVASRSSDHGFDLYRRLTGWFNCRRFNQLKAKAIATGFGHIFDEEWEYFGIGDPRNQRGIEVILAFDRAKRRYQSKSA